jgi:TatD DNase family protein
MGIYNEILIQNMVDIGSNLCSNKFSDVNTLLSEAASVGVSGVIITGSSKESNDGAIDIIKKWNEYVNTLPPDEKPVLGLYATCGIHPHNADSFNHQYRLKMDDIIHYNKDVIVAIGECGLDYNRMFSSKENQIKCFRSHINMAVRYKLPLFIHERDAFDDVYEVLNERKDELNQAGVKCVIHCFTGTKEQAKKYVDIGCYIGVTGWLCDKKRNGALLEAIACIPEDRLMIETDSPHLRPKAIGEGLDTTYYDKYPNINVPANLIFVQEEVTRLTGISLETVKRNTLNFFGIKNVKARNHIHGTLHPAPKIKKSTEYIPPNKRKNYRPVDFVKKDVIEQKLPDFSSMADFPGLG